MLRRLAGAAAGASVGCAGALWHLAGAAVSGEPALDDGDDSDAASAVDESAFVAANAIALTVPLLLSRFSEVGVVTVVRGKQLNSDDSAACTFCCWTLLRLGSRQR